MTAQNADLIRRGYDAFARADLPAVFGMLDQQITWHVPGSSPLSGAYQGHGEVGGFFARTMELSAGTFAVDIQQVLAAGDQVVVLCTVSAERHGRSWSSPEVHVWRVAGGRAVAFREFQGNEQTEDAFWSS
jgi:uncharacterized protein